MAETETTTRPALQEPSLRDFSMPEGGDLAVVEREATTPMFKFKEFAMTAEKVGVSRAKRDVLAEVAKWCAIYADRYMYSWEVNDRKKQRKVVIEGPTIKMAEMVARAYGNCFAGVINVEKGKTHWTLYAAFIDFETGFNLVRPFEQRMDQELGMGDKNRERDILLQIAASKATRNVIVNALDPEIEYGIEIIRKSLLEWVKNPAKLKQIVEFVDGVLDRFNLDIKRVERVVGKKRDDWSPRDMVRVLMEMRAINDESIRAADIYPHLEATEPSAEPPKSEAKKKDAPKQTKATGPTPEQQDAANKQAAQRTAAVETREPAAESESPEPPAEETPAETTAPRVLHDALGEVFDPEIHRSNEEGKPVYTKAGAFSKKRGRPQGSTKQPEAGPQQAQQPPQEQEQTAPPPAAEPETAPQTAPDGPPAAEEPPPAEKPKQGDAVGDPFNIGIGAGEDFSFDDD